MGNVKDIDRGWKQIRKQLGVAEGKPYVKIGVLSDAGAYADGGVNLADVATFNEFGTSSIPSRPFMSQTFDTNQQDIKEFIEKQYSGVLSLKQTISDGLKKIGVWYTGKVKEIFTKGEFAPNSPSTLAAKYPSTRPLIDTGRLRQSIDHEVVMK